MTTLSTPISDLPKVGKSITKNLQKLGIETVSNLLFYFPYKHLDFSKFSKIKDIHPGQVITIKAVVKTINSRFSFRSRLSLCEAIVSDDTGSLSVVWFNQPYIKDYLHSGDEVLLSGKPTFYKKLQLANPIYERASEDTTHTGRVVPVYHLTENLYNKTIRNLIKTNLSLADEIKETIPEEIQKLFNLQPLPTAIKKLHFPESEQDLINAKLRISFDEVFLEQLAVQKRNLELKSIKTSSIKPDIELTKAFVESLPFTLTAGQKSAAWQIMQELEGPRPMNRLLEGDVGSGKTLVAILSILASIKQGYQVALLAPTEILAQQHYQTFNLFLKENKKFNLLKKTSIALVTNSYRNLDNKTYTKAVLSKKISEGKVDIIIGTHALLYGSKFKNLGIIIIDEQHRFGVEQRARLIKQHSDNSTPPHLLSMTATPIPRTLALTLYSDLSITKLTQIPTGRKPIITEIVPENNREKIYRFIKKELINSRQAFIITPRVEETEKSNTKSVKTEFERLSKEIFPEYKLGLLYGKMKSADKEKVMKDFNDAKIDILVATSVIEIGIDVPNATIMIIEGAQNFGLAQLHQLRGRVGRGKLQSYCFLFTDVEEAQTLERLKTFSSTLDGFKLAEMDLEQRGFGDLFGSEQSGFNYKFSRFITMKTFQIAKEAANWILNKDPKLKTYKELSLQTQQYIEKIHLE